MAKTYKKLYLMTLPRSGSTLLGQQLGIHNRIFHLGETAYWELLDVKDTVCSCGEINCQFLNKLTDEIKGKHMSKPLLKVWQIVDNKYWPNKTVADGSVFRSSNEKIKLGKLDYWLDRCPESLNKIIKIYSKYTNKDIFLDNTKLPNIGKKLSFSKDWGIILLLRDPRGIMCSYKMAGINKKDFRRAESVLPFCEEFIDSSKQIINKENVILIRYEDFCSSTKDVLIKLCNFIGVDFQKEMLQIFTVNKILRGHVLKGNRLLKSNEILSISEDKKWLKILTDRELKYLYRNRKLVDFYTSFGYSFD